MLIDTAVYVLSFVAIWFGAGLIISSVEELSKKLNISSFAVSFFVLGILTSIPEASVGINSIIDRDPEIFVGNLIGASLVLFLLVIPILAVAGNGIRLAHQLDGKSLLVSLREAPGQSTQTTCRPFVRDNTGQVLVLPPPV